MLEHTPCRKELGNGSDTTQLLAFLCFEHSLPPATLHPSQLTIGPLKKRGLQNSTDQFRKDFQ